MAYNYEWPYTDPNRYNDDWLLTKMKELLHELEEIKDWQKEFSDLYEELNNYYKQLIAGTFPEPLKQAFHDWMQKNAVDIVGNMVKNVFFGLTDTGYFIAYIPESWSDIIFNTTGLDVTISDVDYGHLILSY